jgi:hypothetical protein
LSLNLFHWPGSQLWVVSAADGNVLEKHALKTLPVWDGMAVADGSLYLATEGGVMCMVGMSSTAGSLKE